MASPLPQPRGGEAYTPLYAGARAAAALAGGEAAGAFDRGPEGLHAGFRLDGEAGLQRQAEALDRRAAVRQHRDLWECGERLGVLERAVQVAAGRDELRQ